MKTIIVFLMSFFLCSCVYAPSQAWKPHLADESKKKYKSKKVVSKTDKNSKKNESSKVETK
ncbi:MAG: hypothetical protein EAZ27_11505 [Cytophagales bacterium]|nr:MAG: hypothetical protein EAZ27_11505 [Cytophagales bacterium]